MTTKKKNPLRSTPKVSTYKDLDEFAAGAGKKVKPRKQTFPWEDPRVRDDVKKTLPLRIDEPLYLKLKFIAEQTPYSMNSFILERLTSEIEAEIAKLTE